MLRYGELTDVLKNYCELGMYDPKSGDSDEVLVMNLFFTEEDAARDLKSFIEYMPFEIVDVTIDTSIGTDGDFKIFIELENDADLFKKVCKILRDCSNVADIGTWSVKLYKKDARNIKVEDLEKFLGITQREEK